MKRVLIVGPRESDHVTLWVNAFKDRGHRVDLVSVPEGSAPRWCRMLRAAATRIRPRPDVTIVHSMGTHGLVALARGNSGRTVLVPWGSEVTRAVQGGWRGWLAGALLRRADVVITTSTAMSTLISTHWPRAASRIRVISWGVAAEFLTGERTAERTTAVKRDLGLAADSLLVVAPRGRSETYRHATLIESFHRARQRNAHLRLVVIGEGRGGLGDHLEEADFVRVLPRLRKPELARLLRAADAVVSIPKHDQRSTTVLEAIASGGRVLLSEIPPYQELVVLGLDVTLLPEPIGESLTHSLAGLGHADVALGQRNRAVMRRHEHADTQMSTIVELCLEG